IRFHLIILFMSTMLIAQTNTSLPKFEDYHIKNIYSGKTHTVAFHNNPQARMFRTVLRNGAIKGANFAGHYTVVIWGCGTSCQSFAIIDQIDGKVYFAKELSLVSYADYLEDDYGLKFRPDSRLLIVNGRPDEDRNKGRYYYEWKDNKLKLIKMIPVQ
ncbi:MAG: hypothetical protein Q8940_19070, partial [Bacteroidota bacterium]|nr:hypothetical protein [Bacteroidota bacterium]